MKKYISIALAALIGIGANAQNNTEMNGSNTLVAWFSWSHNTEVLAKHIAQKTGADLFRSKGSHRIRPKMIHVP